MNEMYKVFKKGIDTFIVAELSANHNGNYDIAVKTIKAMANSGADAVKIQTYKPESLTIDLKTGFFQPFKDGLWKGSTLWDLYKKAATPYEWQPKLKKTAEDFGLVFFSSPFDFEGVDFLDSIGVPIYKVASFEITDIPLISHIASKGKPIIMSTGVADIDDIELALKTCYNVGNKDVSLLKCTSNYPAKIKDANLITIPDMIKRFELRVGVSDHTPGSLVPTTAVSLGATIVEKHFILDRSLGGPDAAFSMEPHEFKEMVDSVREVEKALGKVSYEVSENDKSRRRSIFAVKDIKKNEIFSEENIRSIRPGFGLHPKFLPEIIGQRAKTDIKKGTPFTLEYVHK